MVTSVSKEQRGEDKPYCGHMETWGECTLQTRPLLRGCAAQGRAQRSWPCILVRGPDWTGQHAETQGSDVIGKRSNQGSRRVSTVDHSPQESHLLPAVVLGS